MQDELINFSFYFQIRRVKKMQVESNNGLRSRFMIPPCIDLSAVTVCSSETEKRWKSNQNGGSNFNKSLLKTTNSENVEIRIGADQLPIGNF